MTTWNVTGGRWRVTDGTGMSREIDLERTAATRLSFPSQATTTLDFALISPVQPPEQRPDIGIGADDLTRSGRTFRLTVHSLGSVDAPAGVATVEDAAGHALATAPIPPITAPRDLVPHTATVSLRAPVGAARVTVKLGNGAAEITQLNNAVTLAR